MTKEALKLALEALEEAADAIDSWGSYASEYFQVKHDLENDISKAKSAITAIKEALAQPEQEPFEYWNAVEGWVKIDEVRDHFDSVGCGTIYKTSGEDRVPLYTTPPQRTWIGLTDEEVDFIANKHATLQGAIWAIEAKLRSKNYD